MTTYHKPKVQHLEGRQVGHSLCGDVAPTARLLHRVTCPQCLVVLDTMTEQGFKPKKVYGSGAGARQWFYRPGPKRPFAALFVRGAAVRGWLEARSLKQPSDVLTAAQP